MVGNFGAERDGCAVTGGGVGRGENVGNGTEMQQQKKGRTEMEFLKKKSAGQNGILF
jgi:hypothetical protein